MALFTLTSDLGTEDYYVAAVKGKILKSCPDAVVIDISHHIRPFDIRQAGYVLHNAYKHFPDGTIHLVNVSSDKVQTKRYILVRFNNHFFIAPDNGLLSLVIDTPELIVSIATDDSMASSFPLLDIISTYACRLANGESMESLGEKAEQMQSARLLRPVIHEDVISGVIVFIDHYGNAIVNIRQSDFNELGKGKNFVLQLRHNESIRRVSKTYSDVPEGEKLCLFNHAGYLEIAINMSRASDLLGMKTGDSVHIKFEA